MLSAMVLHFCTLSEVPVRENETIISTAPVLTAEVGANATLCTLRQLVPVLLPRGITFCLHSSAVFSSFATCLGV